MREENLFIESRHTVQRFSLQLLRNRSNLQASQGGNSNPSCHWTQSVRRASSQNLFNSIRQRKSEEATWTTYQVRLKSSRPSKERPPTQRTLQKQLNNRRHISLELLHTSCNQTLNKMQSPDKMRLDGLNTLTNLGFLVQLGLNESLLLSRQLYRRSLFGC